MDRQCELEITKVRFMAANPTHVANGLLGWVACTLNGILRLEGIALRRTADNRLALSFPSHRDAAGNHHFYLRPLSDAARREIEHQVLSAIAHAGQSLRG